MPILISYPVTQSLQWDAGEGGGAVASQKIVLDSIGFGAGLPPDQRTFALSALNLQPGSVHTLAVRADNAAGMTKSAAIEIQVEQPLQPPAAPVNLQIV